MPTRENFTQSAFNFAETPSIKTETASPSVIDAGSHALGQHKFIDFTHNREEAKKFFCCVRHQETIEFPLGLFRQSSFIEHLRRALAGTCIRTGVGEVCYLVGFFFRCVQKGFLVFGCSFPQLKMRCIQKCLPAFIANEIIVMGSLWLTRLIVPHAANMEASETIWSTTRLSRHVRGTLASVEFIMETTCEQQFSTCPCHLCQL